MPFASIYAFFALSLFMGFMPLPPIVRGILRFIGMHWIGIGMYLVMLFILADTALFFAKTTRIINTPVLPRVRLYSGFIVILLTFAIVFYGMHNANHIKNVTYEIQLKNAVLDDMKIVLISDLHIGEIRSEKNLAKIVENINSLNPDIVCIPGDIFNDSYYAIRNPERAIALLRSIKSKHGVYASLGNHDGGPTFHKMIDFLEKSNITLLNDEYRIIDGRLALFGRLDHRPIGGFGPLKRQDITETIISVSANFPVVVMDHNPINIREYDKEADLILSGHTHRGQVFPGSLITRAINVVDYGHYQKDANSPHVIVTSGVNTWGPPMRVGTNNEVVSILLR
ncbi:MAG: metallophosphoesterase [Chitinispirillia bacterium]|nr:metallophosphoesterase [Chitinispirillia bacterium]